MIITTATTITAIIVASEELLLFSNSFGVVLSAFVEEALVWSICFNPCVCTVSMSKKFNWLF